jgi:phage tail sheath gpL-like
MSAVNNPVVNVKLIPDTSDASFMLPRALLVGTVPAAMNSIFGDDAAVLLGDGMGVGYELSSDAEMKSILGTGSTYHRWKAAVKGSKTYVPIDILLVKNTNPAADTTKITFTGAALTKGTLKVAVFDEFQFFANVRHEIGMTAEAMAAAVAELLNAPKNKPYAATVSGAEVTLTWVDGFVTNSTPVHVKTIDKGFAPNVTHSAQSVPTQPLIDLFDMVGETRYTSTLWPEYYRDTAQFPLSFLLSRFNADNQIVDGVVYTTQTNTLSGVIDDTASVQGQPIVFASDRQIDGLFGASIGSNATKLADIRMAFVALAIDRSRVDGADVTDIVSGARGLADYTGGAELASLPYHNIAIPDTVPSNPKWYWSQPEQRILRENNISTWGVNRAGNTEITGDMLTMWKTDAAGNPNTTWTSLEDLWTSSTVREYTDSSLRVFFSKSRMTNGDVVFDRSMENEATIKNKVLGIYRELGQMCLCTAGGVAEKKMLATLTVKLNPKEKTVEINAVFEIITHVGVVTFNLRITQQYK